LKIGDEIEPRNGIGYGTSEDFTNKFILITKLVKKSKLIDPKKKVSKSFPYFWLIK
jgi:hypothetical protein